MKINDEEVEILVVDDDPNLASSVAEMITASLGIKAEGMSEPAKALEHVANGRIKVAVLDQVMPEMTGVAMTIEIHKINKFIQCILFSGQADSDDVSSGYGAGIVKFMNKRDLKSLPSTVYDAYAKYYIAIQKDLNEESLTLLYSYRSLNLKSLFSKTQVYLVDSVTLDKTFHFDNWTTVVELDCEKYEITDTVEFEEDLQLEVGSDERLQRELKLGKKIAPIVEMKIQHYISEKFNIRRRYKVKDSHTVKKTYEKPKTVVGNLVVVKRVYERTPVYLVHSVLLCTICPHCGMKTLFNLKVYQRIPRYLTRTLDYVEGRNEPIINETGFGGG